MVSDPFERARRYDDVAQMYERHSAPTMFAAPARALVEALAPLRGRVLDVGAGTGAVACAALDAGGAAVDVVAVDPSSAMLEAAQRAGVATLVAGCLPDLPFSDATFDMVLSAFVLTHVDDPDAAAREMARVLRRPGRVALSAWAPATDAYSNAWSEVAAEFAGRDALAATARYVLPNDERLGAIGAQGDLLAGAGFDAPSTSSAAFSFEMSVDTFVYTREVSASGRAMRALLTDAEWSAFRAATRERLGARFPTGVRLTREVFITTAWLSDR